MSNIDATKPLADVVAIANSAALCGMRSPVSDIYKRAINDFLQENAESTDPETVSAISAIKALRAVNKVTVALNTLKSQELKKYQGNDALLSRHARALFETYINQPFSELEKAIREYAGDRTEISKLADILRHEARSIELELTNQIGARKVA